MNVLEHEVPGLASQLEALSAESRRLVIIETAKELSGFIEGLESGIEETIAAALVGDSVAPAQLRWLMDFADSADMRHFKMQEQGDMGADSMTWFAKARIAAALADILGGDRWTAAADAAYELCFVLDDNSLASQLLRDKVTKYGGRSGGVPGAGCAGLGT